ncbi:hypothetical protein AGOR_G00111300 [Albula goreensis]|uniref:Glutamate-rich protein 1 n=1 Tax=Albula goreensis TaxID=1534307 RepID=A0A8T3DED8_9TELE|nr:hypothetical protein AGOR_G00111300 [Albula goreensis]
MANRKQVFQEKLMKRLYQSPAETAKPQTSVPSPGPLPQQPGAKVKTSSDVVTGDKGKPPHRRLYTVLPPPDGYRAEEPATLSEPGDINTEGGPADDIQGKDGDGGQRRRRRRKRRLHRAAGGEGKEEEGGMGRATEGVPDAAGPALPQWSSRTSQEEEEEESRQKSLAELLDFLQTTQQIYLSDRKRPAPDPAMQGLLARLEAGTAPPAVLAQLQGLKAVVLLQDGDRLTSALEEFQRGSSMPSVETSSICSLFNYWLTDILPMRTNKTPGGQTTATAVS